MPKKGDKRKRESKSFSTTFNVHIGESLQLLGNPVLISDTLSTPEMLRQCLVAVNEYCVPSMNTLLDSSYRWTAVDEDDRVAVAKVSVLLENGMEESAKDGELIYFMKYIFPPFWLHARRLFPLWPCSFLTDLIGKGQWRWHPSEQPGQLFVPLRPLYNRLQALEGFGKYLPPFGDACTEMQEFTSVFHINNIIPTFLRMNALFRKSYYNDLLKAKQKPTGVAAAFPYSSWTDIQHELCRWGKDSKYFRDFREAHIIAWFRMLVEKSILPAFTTYENIIYWILGGKLITTLLQHWAQKREETCVIFEHATAIEAVSSQAEVQPYKEIFRLRLWLQRSPLDDPGVLRYTIGDTVDRIDFRPHLRHLLLIWEDLKSFCADCMWLIISYIPLVAACASKKSRERCQIWNLFTSF